MPPSGLASEVASVGAAELPLRHLRNRVFILMPGQWTRCLVARSSQARGISTARQSSVAHIVPLKGSGLGPIQQDGQRTFRTRKAGNKELPLPPLLDPVVLEKRSRYEQKKERPKLADFTPFQRRLWESPFGRPHTRPASTTANHSKHKHLPLLFANAAPTPYTCPPHSSPLCTCTHIPRPAIHGCSLSP